MKKKMVGLLGALLLLSYSGIGSAHEEEESNWSATFAFWTNFMYRGISFSNDEPTVWGSIDYSNGPWFAGLYGIALGDQDGSGPVTYELEIDYYGGYASSWGDIEWYAMLIYLQYVDCDATNVMIFFGADRPLECDFAEIWLDASYPLGDYVTLHALYAYSNDFEFESGDSHYFWGDVTFALGDSPWSVHAGLGHWDVEGGTYSLSFGGTEEEFGWHYINYQVGIGVSWQGLDFDLSWHDTDGDGPTDSLRNYIPDPQFTDSEVVFQISRTF